MNVSLANVPGEMYAEEDKVPECHTSKVDV
jgi:hypothetical protein